MRYESSSICAHLATFYRKQAVKLRSLMRTEIDEPMREQILALARHFDKTAATIEAGAYESTLAPVVVCSRYSF